MDSTPTPSMPEMQPPGDMQRQVLRRASRLLASASDFAGTLRQTIGACLPALGDFGFFDVVHGDRVIRTVVAHEAPDVEAILAPTQWVPQVRDDGMNLCALTTGEAAFHPDITEAWYSRVAPNEDHLAAMRQLAFCSMISVPMRHRDELVGALTLFMARSRRHHTRDDLEFAAEIAQLAVPVVENARLAEQHHKARRRLEIIARAGEALSRSLDPDETLRTIGRAIVPEIGDWCRIDLLDEQGALQRRLAHHADSATAERAFGMTRRLRAKPTTVGSMASVIRTGEPAHGHFRENEDDSDLHLFTTTFGMGAYFIVPLKPRGRTIGAMAVIQAESQRELGADDRALVMELAHRAAMALDNARLYSAAETANRAKDEFLAMLGHELRNPLAPIATALELMAMRDAQAHEQERRVIGRQVAHLSRLIDDLLDVSRITSGKIQLLREPVDMKAVVANAVELTKPLFEKHRRPLSVVMQGGDALVDGDAVRLTQVLCNLLTNAAKFTPHDGHVVLRLRRAGQTIEIEVEDTGSGIDAQLLPHVFDLFVQGRQAIDRRAGGLGLGLAIVKTLVQLHGGEVQARSDGTGRGARFVVRLPAGEHAPAPTAAPAPLRVTDEGGRVLIVDDNVDAAETLAELLRTTGYQVRCTHHANDALDALREFAPGIALLDIGLPDVDGYELARQMRSHDAAKDVRLVALTGYGRDNDRTRAREAGFDEHLVKPVDIDRLLGVLGSLSPSR